MQIFRGIKGNSVNKFPKNKIIGVTKKKIKALLPNYFHSRIECGFHERQMKFFREQCELSREEKRKNVIQENFKKVFSSRYFCTHTLFKQISATLSALIY